MTTDDECMGTNDQVFRSSAQHRIVRTVPRRRDDSAPRATRETIRLFFALSARLAWRAIGCPSVVHGTEHGTSGTCLGRASPNRNLGINLGTPQSQREKYEIRHDA